LHFEVTEEREKWAENVFEEIIANNFLNLGEETSRSRRHRDLLEN